MENEDLIQRLGLALALTKCDAERSGFTYGAQGTCVKALAAFRKWEDAQSPAPAPWPTQAEAMTRTAEIRAGSQERHARERFIADPFNPENWWP